MSNVLRFPDPDVDPRVVRALESVLTPPAESEAYWDGLQRRIMARIAAAGTPSTWWSISPTMARAGLIAAGLALLALGALALQSRETEARVAFQSVTETETEVAKVIPGVDEPYGSAVRTPVTPRR